MDRAREVFIIPSDKTLESMIRVLEAMVCEEERTANHESGWTWALTRVFKADMLQRGGSVEDFTRPFTVAVAFSRRRKSFGKGMTDYLSRLRNGHSVGSPDKDDARISRLLELSDYIIAVLGSEYPSQHREMRRPSLPFPRTDCTRVNTASRRFHYSVGGVSRKNARPGERSSSLPAEGEVMSKWKQLLKAPACGMRIDLRALDDPSRLAPGAVEHDEETLEYLCTDFFADFSERFRKLEIEDIGQLLTEPEAIWGPDWPAAQLFPRVVSQLVMEGYAVSESGEEGLKEAEVLLSRTIL
ncbi:unnamed protein product [Parajaminaea phylloscopi]